MEIGTHSKNQQDWEGVAMESSYQEYTDKYFLRGKQILQIEGINPIVRYQTFARKDIESLVGVDESVDFIKGTLGNKVKISALRNGQSYTSGEPISKYEGRAQDLFDLETVSLGTNSGKLTGALNMNEVRLAARAIREVADSKKVYYGGARHFSPEDDEIISRICYEEGFDGCSTDIGAKAWNSQGMGTIPHAGILVMKAHMLENNLPGNSTVEYLKAFDRNIDPSIPRFTLPDTFNKEIDDTIECAREVPSLVGSRLDTGGSNYSQGSRFIELPKINIPGDYLRGKGVTVASIWALRRALAKEGLSDRIQGMISSGFNAKKTNAFIEADRIYQDMYGEPLFTSILTGSIAKPIMTTSDIVAYFSEKKGLWVPLSKVGRGEKQTNRLEDIK